MNKKTPLYQQHLDGSAKIVNFSGWLMPINYGSQIEEHHQIRKYAGIFDVSHMTILDMSGKDVKRYLEKLLANDINKITNQPGKALYSCLLNESAKVIDDLIVYYMHDNWFRVIVNSATREKDLQWFKQQLNHFEVTIKEREDLAMIAIQGPEALVIARTILSINVPIKAFFATEINVSAQSVFVARTGYTGEDGYELICSAAMANKLWQEFVAVGAKPCGLGARDTLRLEAGMNLYGNDMDETTSPLESGLSWTVDVSNPKRDFIGQTTLLAEKESGVKNKFVGLILQDKGILRAGQILSHAASDEQGLITSGGFSPSMEKSIAFARIPKAWENQCLVQIRKKQLLAKIVKLPFVRKGNILNNS